MVRKIASHVVPLALIFALTTLSITLTKAITSNSYSPLKLEKIDAFSFVHRLSASALQATSDCWPMFQHDAAHSGYSAGLVPRNVSLAWKFKYSGDNFGSQPIVASGIVFLGGDYWGVAYAVNQTTGAEIWRCSAGQHTPAVWQSMVFLGCGSGIKALDQYSGQEIWNTNLNVWGGDPVLSDDKIYVGMSSRTQDYVLCLEAASGCALWNNSGVQEPYNLAIGNGRVFVGYNSLHCLNVSTGELLWNKAWNSSIKSISVFESSVFFTCQDGTINALETDGIEKWRFVTSGAIYSSPAFGYGRVFVASSDENLYCLDCESGDLLWKFNSRRIFGSSPIVADNKVIVAGGNRWRDILYCLDVFSGAVIWEHTLDEPPMYNSPSACDGMIFIGSYPNMGTDPYYGYLFAFKPEPVKPPTPFWNEWWFYATLVSVVAAAVICFSYFRLRLKKSSGFESKTDHTRIEESLITQILK